jgi:hypothetical protein
MAMTQKNPLMKEIAITMYVLQMTEAQHRALRFPNQIHRPNFLSSKLVHFLSAHQSQNEPHQTQLGDVVTTQRQQLRTLTVERVLFDGELRFVAHQENVGESR